MSSLDEVLTEEDCVALIAAWGSKVQPLVDYVRKMRKQVGIATDGCECAAYDSRLIELSDLRSQLSQISSALTPALRNRSDTIVILAAPVQGGSALQDVLRYMRVKNEQVARIAAERDVAEGLLENMKGVRKAAYEQGRLDGRSEVVAAHHVLEDERATARAEGRAEALDEVEGAIGNSAEWTVGVNNLDLHYEARAKAVIAAARRFP